MWDIPEFQHSWREEDHKFEAKLGCIVRDCLNVESGGEVRQIEVHDCAIKTRGIMRKWQSQSKLD